MLYDGNVIALGINMITTADSKETLKLKEESHFKMLLKQNDPKFAEKKINTKPINYALLNQLSDNFNKRFVPQSKLSAEQAFWSNDYSNSIDPSSSSTFVKTIVPKELPKQGDDPIDAIHKMMSFLSTVVSSRFSSTNNQLRNSSNPRQQATVHDGRVTVQPIQKRQTSFGTNMITIADSKETLKLKEESRFKMLLKQNDPKFAEKKINTKPINYALLNQLSDDFNKRFVPQSKLSAEQAFWSNDYSNSIDPSSSSTFVKTMVPKELPKAVEQCCMDKKCFEIQKKQVLLENDRLLDQVLSQDIMNNVVKYSVNVNSFVAM
nr:hypothetical protein [Tanacetum cinerariifolium]